MMNPLHSVRKRPDTVDMEALPFGLRDENKNSKELYATETQIPPSVQEGQVIRNRKNQTMIRHASAKQV
jgi:hypothetical protein